MSKNVWKKIQVELKTLADQSGMEKGTADLRPETNYGILYYDDLSKMNIADVRDSIRDILKRNSAHSAIVEQEGVFIAVFASTKKKLDECMAPYVSKTDDDLRGYLGRNEKKIIQDTVAAMSERLEEEINKVRFDAGMPKLTEDQLSDILISLSKLIRSAANAAYKEYLRNPSEPFHAGDYLMENYRDELEGPIGNIYIQSDAGAKKTKARVPGKKSKVETVYVVVGIWLDDADDPRVKVFASKKAAQKYVVEQVRELKEYRDFVIDESETDMRYEFNGFVYEIFAEKIN